MERKDPQTVGDVLRDFLEETALQARMDELKGVSLWATAVGETIASECSRPVVKNGIMTVGVGNASLRHELHMNRTRLCSIINDMIGKPVIKEIKFKSPYNYESV